MQLVIKDGKVHATYRDDAEILASYDLDEYEIIQWDGPGDFYVDPETREMVDDPRTPTQQVQDQQERYKHQRKGAYPHVQKMLLMLYRDMKNGTNTFVDAIDAIHDRFQQPE